MSSRGPSDEPAPDAEAGEERGGPAEREEGAELEAREGRAELEAREEGAELEAREGSAGPPARPGVSARSIAALVALALALGAVAGVAYQRYAEVHLRALPRVPACVRGARVALRRPVAASGTEPRQTASGETVYLTLGEDRAVACAFQLDEALARRLAGALAEQEPAPRAARLLELVRDHVPADPAHDRAASAAYMMASAAMRVLPQEVPEVRAAAEELDQRHACRFATRRPCPTRPPPPALVWLAGVPAALSLLALLWIGLAASAARYRRWTERRGR